MLANVSSQHDPEQQCPRSVVSRMKEQHLHDSTSSPSAHEVQEATGFQLAPYVPMLLRSTLSTLNSPQMETEHFRRTGKGPQEVIWSMI